MDENGSEFVLNQNQTPTGKVYVKYAGFTHLSPLVCDQGSERLGVEAAVAESQAAIHAVCSQLQGLLTDIILKNAQTQVRSLR